MNDNRSASSISDDQVGAALAQVHGRLRRRRNRLRGAGLSAVVLVVFIGAGAVTQGDAPETEAPVDMVSPDAALPTETSSPSRWATCGVGLVPASQVDLELAIQSPVEWTAPTPLGASQVIVEARNVGTRSLTIWVPAGTAGLDPDAVVKTETAQPPEVPTTITLAPSELVELPASLPTYTCAGEVLDRGRHTIAPIVAVEDDHGSIVLVRGTATVARHP
jgi:hypothetical protein